MKLLQTVGATVATGALFASLATSVFATNSITITGNGKHSINTVTLKTITKSSTSQVNSTSVSTGVDSSAKTGKNKANDNVGGTTGITSGDATSTITVTNSGNTNIVFTPDCGCNTPADTTVDISGNGKGSVNGVTVKNISKTTVDQTNVSTTENVVDSHSSTGGNHANGNVGGDVTVTSGDATSTVNITNDGSSNLINPPSI